jgi:[ribosomal protein S5]-alanine N-acetyltransferase
VEAYLGTVVERFESGDALIMAALDRASGAYIGTSMLFCFEPPAGAEVAELGFWLVAEARGAGNAEAVIGLTLRWGFDELGVRRIQGLTAPSNTSAQRAMARAGMRCEGRIRDHLHPKVGVQDIVMYASEVGDWPGAP